MTEILDRALGIMRTDGVGMLSMAALARDMSIQPPSLYRYYPSLLAIYDALFRQGQQENLDALRRGMSSAEPGLWPSPPRWKRLDGGPSPTRSRRNCCSGDLSRAIVPTPDAFAPTIVIVDLLRAELKTAAATGEIHPDAASDDGLSLLSTMHFGVLSQHLANDPDSDWEHGRYTRLHPRVIELFALAYPPAPAALVAAAVRG